MRFSGTMARHFNLLKTMLVVVLYFGFCVVYFHCFTPSNFQNYRIPSLTVHGESYGRIRFTSLLRLVRQGQFQQQRPYRLCMVNFGPYGDFLNSKVNDDDDGDSLSGGEAPMNSIQPLDYFVTMSSSSLDKIDANAAAGTFRLLDISTESMKPGGLRLFIVMYLLGQIHTPHKQAWKLDRPSSEDYIIDFWFHDQSAILSIELKPTLSSNTDGRYHNSLIHIDRIGSSPSKHYLIQEAVVLQGLLNELLLCATDPSVAEHNRLLILPEEKIEKLNEVCEVLPFG